MASSCLFDLSSNVILIFLEHLCHLNITWFVTWSCWWRHNKVIKRSWIVSSDVPSVLKWGASVLNRATCLIVTYFYDILRKNDILKNAIPFWLKMGSGNLKLKSPTENWLMRSLKVWEKVRVGTFNVELVMRLVGKLYR